MGPNVGPRVSKSTPAAHILIVHHIHTNTYTHILIVHSIQILIYTLSAPYIPYILSYTPVVSPHTPYILIYILIVHQRHLVISPILDSTIAIVHQFPPALVLIKLFSNSDQAREQPQSSLEKSI